MSRLASWLSVLILLALTPARVQAAMMVDACVHVGVQGAVRHPGYYLLPLGARRFDAILKAGGLAPGAQVMGLHLAMEMQDGETLRVPRKGEVLPEQLPVPDRTAREPSRRRGDARHRKQMPAGVLHLNRATAAQLERFPGVGPRMAQDILAYRKAHGAFHSVQELREIRGIGPARLARWSPHMAP